MILKPKFLSTIIKYVLLISIFVVSLFITSELFSLVNSSDFLSNSKGFFVYFLSLIFLILNNLIPLLVAIAFFTVGERKLLASMQRRTGPGKVGFWGSLQAIADGAKLVNKETLIPVKANFYLLSLPIFLRFRPIAQFYSYFSPSLRCRLGMVCITHFSVRWTYMNQRFTTGKTVAIGLMQRFLRVGL